MNPVAILGLLSQLYEQVVRLQEENAALREALTAGRAPEPPPSPEPPGL